MRRWLIALATGGAAVALPVLVQAAVVLWTLTVSPLVVTQGQSTKFIFTLTNLDTGSSIGCAQVDFPSSFAISSLGKPLASHGKDWRSFLSGNSVIVQSEDGGDHLGTGESVTFTVTAVATTAGLMQLTNHIHHAQNCSDGDIVGLPLTVTVLPAVTSTPAPTATASPRPVPSMRPTPTPQPARTTPTPAPTTTPAASAAGQPSAPPSSPSSAASSGQPPIQVASLGGGNGGATNDLAVGVNALGLLGSPFEWLVPGAFVGGPGLLVLLFVVLQAVGALAWIPAVRRMGDEDDDRRRKRRPRGVSRGA